MTTDTGKTTLGDLFDRHRMWLLATIRGRLHPQLRRRVCAADLVQETFLRALSRYERFLEKGEVPPRVWLFGLARECLNEHWERHTALKRNVERECLLPEDSSRQLAAGLFALLTSPSSAVAKSEERALVRAVVERLSQDDQEVLWLRHRDDLEFAEIASLLGLDIAEIRRRHRAAIDRFNRYWKRANA